MSDAVLYIDDDEANLVVFEAAFGQDFEVLTASSGKEGLELLARHEVGVLLVDQRMPQMNGVEVLEHAFSNHPDPVRILITAYSDLTDAIAAINRGRVERYARKPWEPVEMAAMLHDALNVYRMRRKLDGLERRLVETERVYALGVVAAGVAHELRNPLGAIMPAMDLAHMQAVSLEDALRSIAPKQADEAGRLKEHLELAQMATKQMREIIRGMELSNRKTDTSKSVDLREVVQLTLRMLRSQAMHRAQLAVEADPTLVPLVEGAQAQLGQVVLNLVVNSLQAMPKRPVAENKITLRITREKPGEVRLAVEDNGAGIPADVLPKIFDPFFSTKSEGGTGLGLAISRRIMEEAGGGLEVWSEVGKGTRFTCVLKEARQARGSSPPVVRPQP